MSAIPAFLPNNYATWKNAATQNNLSGKTVHTLELASGSKIGYEQYLLLRVLWVVHDQGVAGLRLPEKLRRLLPRANDMLASFKSWKTYHSSFQNSRMTEGSFAIARYYQLLAANTRETTRPNSFDTPIAKRTRYQMQAMVSGYL